MRCIAAQVSRNANGDLSVDGLTVRQGASRDILEATGLQPGDMTGLWERQGEGRITTEDARSWVDTALPDYLYMRTSWGEQVRAADHYRNQIEETD